MLEATQLISADEAARQLRATGAGPTEIADISDKANQATAIVLRMVGSLVDAAWTETTVPGEVHTAIVWTLDVLYQRPDDLAEHLQRLSRFLQAAGYRDPAVA